MSSRSKRDIQRSFIIPGPVGWLLSMADSGIPDKLLPALRVGIFWIALPFIGLLLGSERISGGNYYEAAVWLGCAFLSIVIAVYWDRIIPLRFRAKPQRLEYLHYKDS